MNVPCYHYNKGTSLKQEVLDYMKKLLYNLTVALTESAGSVCFVGVYMHSGRKLRTDSYDNISEQWRFFQNRFLRKRYLCLLLRQLRHLRESCGYGALQQ